MNFKIVFWINFNPKHSPFKFRIRVRVMDRFDTEKIFIPKNLFLNSFCFIKDQIRSARPDQTIIFEETFLLDFFGRRYGKRLNSTLPFFMRVLRLCMKYMHDKWVGLRFKYSSLYGSFPAYYFTANFLTD